MGRITSFSKRIKELLEVRGINQAELSRRSGLSKSTISHYVKGDWEGKQDAVYAIAKAGNCNEAWLMGYDVPMERTQHSGKTETDSTVELEMLVKKYRALDEHGKKIIGLVLNEEYDRIQSQDIRTLKVAARDMGVQEMYVDSEISNDLNQLPETDEDI